ncbi:ATP-binding cassette domain-containing protein, partial [Kitasatospora sp. NPDC058218]|uniref:ATP-binding cassette domain-containing protein n=1 Tax=Kitasatospora sp. NPDC058218 TaxID=3346385 RepID=UPI0036DD0E03
RRWGGGGRRCRVDRAWSFLRFPAAGGGAGGGRAGGCAGPRAAVRLRGLRGPAAADEALALLAGLGLGPAQAARPPAALSGGELQRAALARALIVRPAVLVCDEITSGLDAATRAVILGRLARLRADSGLALLFVTHDLSAADALADSVATMDGGRLLPGPSSRPSGCTP